MITIRKGVNSDIETIAHLANEIWWPTYSSYIPAEQISLMLTDIYATASLEKQIADGHQFILLEEDNLAQGFASYSFIKNYSVCRIHKLYVHPNLQGKGAGKLMINHISSEALKKEAQYLELNVNRNNPAKSFYEKIGFKVAKTVDIPYHEFVLNDFVMQKPLK